MKTYKIVHLADIHIRNMERHDEYQEQFEKLYIELYKIKPDYIALVGDLYESFLTVSNEADTLSGDFLRNLSKIAPTVCVSGNHDLRKSNLLRINSLEKVVKLLDIDNITYLGKSGFFQDKYFDDIVWVNHSHLEKNINPWKDIEHIRDEKKIYVDLFHDPIYGCSNDDGFEFKSKKMRKLSDFNSNVGLFGDIHKRQIWYKTIEKEVNEDELDNYIKNGWKLK